jgi:hypothetical protein
MFVFSTTVLVLLAIFSISAGCSLGSSPDIAGPFAKDIVDMASATLSQITNEVQGMDVELNAAETKLLKLEQLLTPALAWIELTKTKAQQEGWGGKRIIQVTKELNRFQNDQYQIAKLQLGTEMISAGMKFETVINIDDLTTGTITPYEELRDDLKSKISALMQQRGAKVQKWKLVQSTGVAVLEQGSTWKIAKVDNVTYQVAGPGLGWDNSLTRGEWLYYTDEGKLSPSGTPAQALEKLLKGK